MARPAHFETDYVYFKKSLEFFANYQFIYNFRNTDILIEDILNKIDIGNIEKSKIFQKDFQLEHLDNCFIQGFLEEFNNLTPTFELEADPKDLLKDKIIPLSPKKHHEIIKLANEINIICNETACNTVVDFGSGLGYLDQYLHSNFNFGVLGVESNRKYIKSACERQGKYHKNSLEHVKYFSYRIESFSHVAIAKNVQKWFPEKDFCVVGLHACADLSVDAIDLFLKMEHAKSFVIMPCCYHRMSECEDSYFSKFPVSNTLKSVMNEKSRQYIRVPFMRLASEGSRIEQDMETVVFRLLARAVLQQFCELNNYKISRKKRKAVKCDEYRDFNKYLTEALLNGYEISCRKCLEVFDFKEFNTVNKQEIKLVQHCCAFNKYPNTEDILKLWQHYSIEDVLKKAAIFVYLQKKLQLLFENFILFDRISYFKENDNIKCFVKKIIDPKISPRCFAIIAKKIN